MLTSLKKTSNSGVAFNKAVVMLMYTWHLRIQFLSPQKVERDKIKNEGMNSNNWEKGVVMTTTILVGGEFFQ